MRGRRIIPAFAGKGGRSGPPPVHRADHPRVRGEGVEVWYNNGDSTGSSPRSRGRGHFARSPGEDLRIIPAFAGKGLSSKATPASPTDHPRVRGEGVCGMLWVTGSIGSSPRSRGRARCGSRGSRVTRIIPAFAGKGLCQGFRYVVMADHPRVRGEGLSASRQSEHMSGSSPRSRGRAGVTQERFSIGRIIPAFAGKGWSGS